MSTATASVPATTPAIAGEQAPDLRTAVWTAYLQPLLTKHEAAQPITYEDLQGSWQAAQAVLGSQNSALTTELQQLHQSQITSYQTHAQKAVQQHFGETLQPTLTLPPIPSGTTEWKVYAQLCLAWTKKQSWKVPHYPTVTSTDAQVQKLLQPLVLVMAKRAFKAAQEAVKKQEAELKEKEPEKEKKEPETPDVKMSTIDEKENDHDEEEEGEEPEDGEEDGEEDEEGEEPDEEEGAVEDEEEGAVEDEDDEDGAVEEEETKTPVVPKTKKAAPPKGIKGKMMNKGGKSNNNNNNKTNQNNKKGGGKRKPLPSKALGGARGGGGAANKRRRGGA